MMDQQLIDLYHRFAGRAFDQQQHLAEFLKRKAPGVKSRFDIETATLSFGSKLKFAAPLVGSHSAHNDSWMWAWSNRHLKMTITNRALGDTIRAFAHKAMVPELAMPVFAIEQIIGSELTKHACHVFGTVLVGELDYDAYFVVPYEGGMNLLLIRDDRLRTVEKHPLSRVYSVFPKMLATMPVTDQRTAFASYAHSYGLTVAEEASNVTVTGGEKGELTATFDDQGMLTSRNSIGVAMPKPKKVVVKKKPVKPVAKSKVKAMPKPAAKRQAPPKKSGTKR